MGHLYGQLNQNERLEIYHLKRQGVSIRQIAQYLHRAASTISRELHRNGYRQKKQGGDCPVRAQRLYRWRRAKDKSRYKLVRQPELQTVVRDHLAMGWSPQQIAGWLAREQGASVISHESIYRYIYDRARQKDVLYQCLPRRKSRRGQMNRGGRRSARHIPHHTPLSERPAEANTRTQAGHWEIDMMQFSAPGPALLILCERKSRKLVVSRQASLKTADITQGLCVAFQSIPNALRLSATFDNGTEFWRHFELTQRYGMKTYFCDPRAPWQKGSVENAIGRLRRTLPRKTDITAHSLKDLQDIIKNYNATPRQCLDFRTPDEIYATFNQSVALQT